MILYVVEKAVVQGEQYRQITSRNDNLRFGYKDGFNIAFGITKGLGGESESDQEEDDKIVNVNASLYSWAPSKDDGDENSIFQENSIPLSQVDCSPDDFHLDEIQMQQFKVNQENLRCLSLDEIKKLELYGDYDCVRGS